MLMYRKVWTYIKLEIDTFPLNFSLKFRIFTAKLKSRNCVVGIDVKSVTKDFEDGEQVVTALHETDIKILEGEITVILGKFCVWPFKKKTF